MNIVDSKEYIRIRLDELNLIKSYTALNPKAQHDLDIAISNITLMENVFLCCNSMSKWKLEQTIKILRLSKNPFIKLSNFDFEDIEFQFVYHFISFRELKYRLVLYLDFISKTY